MPIREHSYYHCMLNLAELYSNGYNLRYDEILKNTISIWEVYLSISLYQASDNLIYYWKIQQFDIYLT